MSPDLVLVIVVAAFFVMLVCETPVAWALAGAGGLGLVLLRDVDLVSSTLGSAPFTATANYSLAIIPMYILLGMFALHGKLAERLYALASSALRGLPGGLGVATVGACAGFAAVTGSSIATAATIGRISIHEMRKFGYPAAFAAGIVATAGTLGVLIPPSIVIVFYGILANESIALLLVAGILPGILSAVMYATWIVFRARSLVTPITPSLADVLDELAPARSTASAAMPAAAGSADAPSAGAGSSDTAQLGPGSADLRAVPLADDGAVAAPGQSLRAVLWILGIFALVLGGIYTGYFTVIESGAMAAALALVMLLVENSRSGLRAVGSYLKDSMVEAANVTSMSFAILIGATILSTFLVLSRVPVRFTEWILAFDVPPIVIVIVLLLALLPLGMFLETLSILIITVPLMHPVVTELGYDGIWFAILVVKMIEIGMITPPVGMNVFVVSGASGVPVEKAFRGVLPFVLVEFAVIAVLIVFPEIVTWLPSLASD